MDETQKAIMLVIQNYLENNKGVRFGQALFNLNIIQFANKQNPAEKDFMLRDIYNDHDFDIMQRIGRGETRS